MGRSRDVEVRFMFALIGWLITGVPGKEERAVGLPQTNDQLPYHHRHTSNYLKIHKQRRKPVKHRSYPYKLRQN